MDERWESQAEWKRREGGREEAKEGSGKEEGSEGEAAVPHSNAHAHTRAGTPSPLNSPASAAPSPICIAADTSVSLCPSLPAAVSPPTPGWCSMGPACAWGAHWAFLGRGTLTRARTHTHTRPRPRTRPRAPAHSPPAHTHAAAPMCSTRGFTCNVSIVQMVVAARGSGPGHRCPASLLGERLTPSPTPQKKSERALPFHPKKKKKKKSG